MKRAAYTEPREGIADRLVAAIVSALAMLLTVLLGPLFVGLHAPGSGYLFGQVYALYGPFHIWGSILVVLAFVLGLLLGPKRMATLYGHLWNTEQPERLGITYGLWAGIASIVAMGYWLAK